MAGRIPKQFIQDVLARTDIVDIVNKRVKLKKNGANYSACCPFHDEKTPSFTVSQQKQFYYCFGCSAHGNAIGFLMEYDHLDFVSAVEDLAGLLGMPVQYENGSLQKPQQDFSSLYELMEQACQYYQKNLRQTPPAIDYLKSREVSGETAKLYRIGFAPEQWDGLHKTLGTSNDTTKKLITTGMLIQKEARAYDRFRNRIVFPIRDLRGRIIGFGGRTMGDEQPKYLNSPETPIFHKSNELYGLYEARQANNKLKQVLVVEGYMDVISLAQHGITCAAATLGTANNVHHLQKVLRHTDTIIFCFDGDNAGRGAAWKALSQALPLLRDGIHFRFMFLPQGEDPDSLVRNIGKEAFEQLMKNANNLEDVFFGKLQQDNPLDSLDGKAHFAKSANQLINNMPAGIYRQLMYERLQQTLGTEVEQLLHKKPTPAPSVSPPIVNTSIKGILSPAQLASAILLQQPTLIAELPDTAYLAASKAPDKMMLNQIIAILKQHASTNTGQLLAHLNNESSSTFATLSARKLPIPEEGFKAELLGAMQRIEDQYQQHQVIKLISKARSGTLADDERSLLNQLLAKKTQNASAQEKK